MACFECTENAVTFALAQNAHMRARPIAKRVAELHYDPTRYAPTYWEHYWKDYWKDHDALFEQAKQQWCPHEISLD